MEALLFMVGLGLFYALTYVLNRNTPIPEGCEDLTQSCHGCSISSCELHPAQKPEGGIA
jgi:hypothetical protein